MVFGGGGFGFGDEENIHLQGPQGTGEVECFAEAAFDAVAGDGGFENFGAGDEADFGGLLAWAEAEGKKWAKNNAPPLREEGEVAHAAQAISAWEHGINAC